MTAHQKPKLAGWPTDHGFCTQSPRRPGPDSVRALSFSHRAAPRRRHGGRHDAFGCRRRRKRRHGGEESGGGFRRRSGGGGGEEGEGRVGGAAGEGAPRAPHPRADGIRPWPGPTPSSTPASASSTPPSSLLTRTRVLSWGRLSTRASCPWVGRLDQHGFDQGARIQSRVPHQCLRHRGHQRSGGFQMRLCFPPRQRSLPAYHFPGRHFNLDRTVPRTCMRRPPIL